MSVDPYSISTHSQVGLGSRAIMLIFGYRSMLVGGRCPLLLLWSMSVVNVHKIRTWDPDVLGTPEYNVSVIIACGLLTRAIARDQKKTASL